jgi:hypothetical protein
MSDESTDQWVTVEMLLPITIKVKTHLSDSNSVRAIKDDAVSLACTAVTDALSDIITHRWSVKVTKVIIEPVIEKVNP